MKRLILALLAVVGVAAPLVLWAQVGAPVNTPPGSVWTYLGPTYGASWVLPQGLSMAWVPNNSALGTLVTSAPQVYRAGFYAPGDGGAAVYTKSASACSLAAGVGDNGSQVKSSEGGCWLLSVNAIEMDFRVWGAKVGTNVDAPLQKALDWACGSHIPILVPQVGTTPYFLNSAITIGNGSATQNSTCTGVTLKGNQTYPDGTSGQNGNVQVFKWNGGPGIIPLNAQGPANTINFINLGIDCNFICATGFRMHNIMQGTYKWLGVYNQTGPAYIFTSEPTNVWIGGMEASEIHDLTAINPGVGGSGVLVGSAAAPDCYAGASTINNVFDRMVLNYDGNTAGTYGIKLRYTNQVTFRQVTALRLPGSGLLGRSIIVEPATGTGCGQFPTDIKFDTVFMKDVQINGSWVPQIGGINIEQWSPGYGRFPQHPQGYIFGTDTTGISHPGGPWTPTDTSGAGLAITVTDARYIRSGGTCTVEFNITYPTNSNGTNTYMGGLPIPTCLPYLTATSVVGAPFVYTDMGSPASLLCDNAGGCRFYNNQTTHIYTNAEVSGKTFRFAASFIVQPQWPPLIP